MACYRPLAAHRFPGGSSKFGAAALGADGSGRPPLQLPCGRCVGCRNDKAQEWMVRICHETLLHRRNCFVTLTYDKKNLPHDTSLDKTHWQKFAKRLRKRIGPFRYYAVGEYGDKSLRPHYHAIVFGHNFFDDRDLIRDTPPYLWTSPTLEKAWGKGLVSFGAVTPESAAYVAGYTRKKAFKPRSLDPNYLEWEVSDYLERYGRSDENGEFYCVEPEFAVMSRGDRSKDPVRGKGIGHGWTQKFKSDYFPCDEIVMRGKKYRVPRYYIERLAESEQEEVKSRRREMASKLEGEHTPERLKVREQVATARARLNERVL